MDDTQQPFSPTRLETADELRKRLAREAKQAEREAKEEERRREREARQVAASARLEPEAASSALEAAASIPDITVDDVRRQATLMMLDPALPAKDRLTAMRVVLDILAAQGSGAPTVKMPSTPEEAAAALLAAYGKTPPAPNVGGSSPDED